MKKIMFVIAMTLVTSHFSLASEIDSFTKRYEKLPDSSGALNALASKHLHAAIDEANQQGRCSKAQLFKSLRNHFAIILSHGKFTLDMMSSPEIVKRAVPRTQSIYKYHTKTDGYLLVRPAADRDGIGMGAMIQFGDLYMGTDKFEHLFGRGYVYYYEHFMNQKPLDQVLEMSAQDEKHLLGGMWFETGVFSYADLVANFNGIRFWNDFLKLHPDTLGRELKPVVKCEDKKWTIQREINFADYIDAGLDESLNCVQTSTHHGAEGILKSLAELESQDPGREYRCPMGVDRIPGLMQKYGEYSKWLFNFKGIKPFEYNFPIPFKSPFER